MKLNRHLHDDALFELLVEPDSLDAELELAKARIPDLLVERIMTGLSRAPMEEGIDPVTLRLVPCVAPLALASSKHSPLSPILACAGRLAASIAFVVGGFTALAASDKYVAMSDFADQVKSRLVGPPAEVREVPLPPGPPLAIIPHPATGVGSIFQTR